MNTRSFALAALACAALAACDKGQQLPFEQTGDPVTRTVGDNGATVSCVTGTAGSCSVTSPTFKTNAVGSTTFAVSGVTGTNMTYSPSLFSAATSLTIAKP